MCARQGVAREEYRVTPFRQRVKRKQRRTATILIAQNGAVARKIDFPGIHRLPTDGVKQIARLKFFRAYRTAEITQTALKGHSLMLRVGEIVFFDDFYWGPVLLEKRTQGFAGPAIRTAIANIVYCTPERS